MSAHTDDERHAALLRLLKFASYATTHIVSLDPELLDRLAVLHGRDLEDLTDDLMDRYDAAELDDVLFPDVLGMWLEGDR